MTKIKLELEETDLFNAIKKIIDHPNRVEIAKTLTTIIAPNERLSFSAIYAACIVIYYFYISVIPSNDYYNHLEP